MLCILFATNAFAQNYDFVYNAYGNVKLYCKITKQATSTKSSGRGEVTIVGGTGPSGSEVYIDLVSNNGYGYKPTAISSQAFNGATWIGKLYLQGYEKSVGDYAFRGCTGLTYVSINQASTLGIGEFRGCTGLTSVSIPQSITTIPDECFYECSNLKSLQIGSDVQTIGSCAFYGCSSLTSLTIPNSVTSIGEQAFYGCSGLTSLTIGNSVKSIGNWAFYRCSKLTSIEIPNSVTSIGSYAFKGCSGLETIKVNWSQPLSVPNGAFENVDKSLCKLYVPGGTKSLYASADVWEEFLNIVEEGSSAIPEDVNNDGKVNATDAMLIYNYILSH